MHPFALVRATSRRTEETSRRTGKKKDKRWKEGSKVNAERAAAHPAFGFDTKRRSGRRHGHQKQQRTASNKVLLYTTLVVVEEEREGAMERPCDSTLRGVANAFSRRIDSLSNA
jgi:hypothetical protein